MALKAVAFLSENRPNVTHSKSPSTTEEQVALIRTIVSSNSNPCSSPEIGMEELLATLLRTMPLTVLMTRLSCISQTALITLVSRVSKCSNNLRQLPITLQINSIITNKTKISIRVGSVGCLHHSRQLRIMLCSDRRTHQGRTRLRLAGLS